MTASSPTGRRRRGRTAAVVALCAALVLVLLPGLAAARPGGHARSMRSTVRRQDLASTVEFDPATGQQAVYYVGADSQIHGWYFNGTAWSDPSLGTGPPAASDTRPAVAFDLTNGRQDVFYIGSDGQVHVWYFNGSSWVNASPGDGPAAAANTSPVVQYDNAKGEQDVYYIGSDGQVHVWYFNGSSWSNASLGNGEPAVGVVVTGGQPAPGNGPTTIAPKPRKGHVHVRIMISWRWAGAHTRLRRLRLMRFPGRHATIVLTCSGRGCPRRSWSARSGHLNRLKKLEGATFRAGDRISIVIAQPGLVSERADIRIRNNREPTAALL
jgi:hypothetical protein